LRRWLREWRPSRAQFRVFLGYCLASAVYMAIGVTVTDFLYSFWVGVAYVVVAAWLIPTLVRRIARGGACG
jgi:hypothetical protein